MQNKTTDQYFMSLALKEAKHAFNKNEVPIGCVIVLDNKIISKTHNLKIKNKDATAHAEILAIKKACKKFGDWRLENTTMYVTVEPCLMCCGAIIHSRIARLVFSIAEPKMGAVISITNSLDIKNMHHSPKYSYGILEDESKLLMKDFFKKLRNKKE